MLWILCLLRNPSSFLINWKIAYEVIILRKQMHTGKRIIYFVLPIQHSIIFCFFLAVILCVFWLNDLCLSPLIFSNIFMNSKHFKYNTSTHHMLIVWAFHAKSLSICQIETVCLLIFTVTSSKSGMLYAHILITCFVPLKNVLLWYRSCTISAWKQLKFDIND